MTDSSSQQGKFGDLILGLLGDLFFKARHVQADRMIITPPYFYGRDNIIFVIPQGFKQHCIASTTETYWQAIIERVKVDAGLDHRTCNVPQDGEIFYYVSGLGDDSRVFVSIKTTWRNGYEIARLLLA